jgi:Outer membrane protein beta-barrel domain
MDHKYIDEFFKNKLEEREIPFDHDAWLAAEKMIEASERNPWWARFIRLYFLLPFLIGGVLLFVHYTETNAVRYQQQGLQVLPLSEFQQNKQSRATSEINTTAPNTVNSETTTTSAEQVVLSIVPTLRTEQQQPTSNQGISKKSEVIVPVLKAVDQPVLPRTLTVPAPSIILKQEPQAFVLPEGKGTILEKNNNPATSGTPAITIVDFAEDAALQSTGETEVIAYQSAVGELELESPDYQIKAEDPALKNEVLVKFRRKKFQTGLISSALLTPGFNDLAIGLSGGNIGGTFSWQLSHNWFANANLLYEFHGRNYAFPNGNNSLYVNYQTYGFGVSDNTLNIKVKQSHIISLPIYLKYKMGRHSIDAGMQLAYTLALRGNYEEEVVTPVGTASSREDKAAWLDSDHISPMQYNLMAGYQFDLTNRLSLGLRTMVVPSRFR